MAKPTRRAFLLSAGAAAAASTLRAQVATGMALPDRVGAFAEGSPSPIDLTRSGDRWQAGDIEILTEHRADSSLAVSITAPKTRLMRVRLRWRASFPAGSRFLGDHWERSYGDLEWRGLAGERSMPWYFLASGGGVLNGYGVKTGAPFFSARVRRWPRVPYSARNGPPPRRYPTLCAHPTRWRRLAKAALWPSA